jgi:hypothetical protein
MGWIMTIAKTPAAIIDTTVFFIFYLQTCIISTNYAVYQLSPALRQEAKTLKRFNVFIQETSFFDVQNLPKTILFPYDKLLFYICQQKFEKFPQKRLDVY